MIENNPYSKAEIGAVFFSKPEEEEEICVKISWKIKLCETILKYFKTLIQNSLYKHYIQVGPVLITNSIDPDPSIHNKAGTGPISPGPANVRHIKFHTAIN